MQTVDGTAKRTQKHWLSISDLLRPLRYARVIKAQRRKQNDTDLSTRQDDIKTTFGSPPCSLPVPGKKNSEKGEERRHDFVDA